MTETKKSLLRWAVVIVLLVACVWFTIRNLDMAKVWGYMVSADYLWVLLSIPVMLMSHWVRAFRWKTMLQPVVKHTKMLDLFSAVMAGYAVNNVLPLRTGELVRPYVLARREKISFTSVFATIIVERFIDVVVLFLMLAAVTFAFRDAIKTALPNLPAEKLFVPCIAILIVIALSFWPKFIKMVLRFTIKPLSIKLHDKINDLFDKFAHGFEIVKKPSQYARLIIESLLIWLLYTIPNFLMFFSFGLNKAPFNMNFYDAILLIVISGIAYTIAPTPGAFGFYHPLIVSTLAKLYGVNYELALAYATVNHGLNYLVQVIFGGLFLLRENVKKIPHTEDIEKELGTIVPE